VTPAFSQERGLRWRRVTSSTGRQLLTRRIAFGLAALVVAVVAFLLIRGGDDESPKTKGAIGADAGEIRELASGEGHPVYWAGPMAGDTYEWTALADGRVYVRYLTGGAPVGAASPKYLTVGTYPVGSGPAAIRQAAKLSQAVTFKIPGGGTGLVNKAVPTSVYLSYPKSRYQIEVYDPNPAYALKLVSGGEIKPVP